MDKLNRCLHCGCEPDIDEEYYKEIKKIIDDAEFDGVLVIVMQSGFLADVLAGAINIINKIKGT